MSPVDDVQLVVPQKQGPRLAEVPSVMAQIGAEMQMQCREFPLLQACVDAKFALNMRPLLLPM